MAAILFPTAAESREDYIISAPWTDPVNGGEWWFSASKVRWLPVVAGGGASNFGDLGGVPSDNAALDTALDLLAPLASPTFTGTVTGPTYQATTTAGIVVKNSGGVSLLRVGVYDATTTYSTGVAEGVGIASGNYSHAEGTSTASGSWSHAEGKDSTASGDISHAEGYGTLASGNQSHAAGTQARAIHAGARVMTDSEAANCDSAAIDSCTMRYAGGYRFLGGAATFSGAIGGTTGVFSGAVTAGGTNSWTGSVFSGAQAFSGSVSVTGVISASAQPLRIPLTYALTSDFVTASTSFADATGLAFPVLANKKYAIIAHLLTNKNDASGLQAQYTGPASATKISLRQFGSTSAFTSTAMDHITAFSVASSTLNSFNGDGFIQFSYGVISNGANAGTVQLQLKCITGGTAKIYAGSWIQVTQLD